jgi:hypothetical protein
MMCEWRIGKDLEGKNHDIIEVISGFPGGNEEFYQKY